MSISEDIARQVREFRRWMFETFTAENIKVGNVDDAGYPYWDRIEETFRRVFEEETLEDLSEKDLDNLVYLIARQWDRGTILNWFDKGDRRISQVGMNGFHLYALSVAGLKTKETDARYQFAASLYKLGGEKRVVSLLLKYLQDDDSYTRRLALRSLSRIKYTDIVDEIRAMWQVGDEWDQMMCISLAKDHDVDLFKDLIEQGRLSSKKLLREYVEKNEFGT